MKESILGSVSLNKQVIPYCENPAEESILSSVSLKKQDEALGRENLLEGLFLLQEVSSGLMPLLRGMGPIKN